MKSQDIAIVAVVAIVAAAGAFFLSSTLASNARGQEVEVVQPISAEFGSVDPKYFNAESVNPTVRVNPGPDSNDNPFNTPQE